MYQTDTWVNRVLRGGSFNHLDDNLRALNRVGAFPRADIYYTGFRVVEIPEPTTLLLFALACLVAPRRRR